MKGRQIVIETGAGLRGAALLVDGRLEDLLLDGPDDAPRPGELFWARIDRPVPKLGAAFVKLTEQHQGFLRDAKGLRAGDLLLVQAISVPEAGKAVPVTRRVLHKGRLVIHTPDAPGLNLSRQIRDAEERERLSALVAEILAAEPPPVADPGLILRSRAEGASRAEIAADLAEVFAAREEVVRQMARPAPRRASTETARAISLREWEGPVEEGPCRFAAAGVLDALDTLRSARIDLPSGAWLSVEETRALVAIDVNTGAEFGGAAPLTANLEAAREIPRQLRLRGLGGIVAVDFAPIPKKDRRRVEDALKAAFRRDPVETSLAGWTVLGLFELQRKRERRPVADLLPPS